MTYKTIPAEQLKQIDHGKGVILDVRTGMEHDEKQLACRHVHIPLDELEAERLCQTCGLDKESSVYILCRSGKRAAQAAEKLAASGLKNLFVIEGGILSCESCGEKVKGSTVDENADCGRVCTLSLERQVRVAAGLLVLLGAALALLVHPYFSVIPLFVGGGLVFAGLTDRCGMALLLTRAPWNQTR